VGVPLRIDSWQRTQPTGGTTMMTRHDTPETSQRDAVPNAPQREFDIVQVVVAKTTGTIVRLPAHHEPASQGDRCFWDETVSATQWQLQEDACSCDPRRQKRQPGAELRKQLVVVVKE